MIVRVLRQLAFLVRSCGSLFLKSDVLVELFRNRVELLVRSQNGEVDIVEIFIDSRRLYLSKLVALALLLFQFWNHHGWLHWERFWFSHLEVRGRHE